METVTILDPYERIRELEGKLDHVRGYILDTFEMEDYIPSVLTDIAEILDISLTRQYAVEVTVTYRGTVEIAVGQDIDDLEDQISFDFNLDNGDGWEIEIEQDDVKIKHEDRW